MSIMNNKKAIVITIAIVVTILLGLGVVFAVLKNNNNTPQTESGTTISKPEPKFIEEKYAASDISNTLASDVPSLASNGRPIFDITNTQYFEGGWYLTKIENSTDTSIGPAWVVLRDYGDDNLRVVAGPGTYFPDDMGVPDVVRGAMR